MPDITTLLTGGALVGLLAGFWTKIKAWLLFLFSLVIEDVELNSGWAAQVMLDYLLVTHKRTGLYSRTYGGCQAFDRTLMTKRMVPIELLGSSNLVFWIGRVPLGFLVARVKAGAQGQSSETKIYLRFIRGTVNADKLVAEAIAYFHDSTSVLSENKQHKLPRYSITYWRNNLKSEDPNKPTDPTKKKDSNATYSFYRFEHTYNDWTKHPSNRIIGDADRFSQIRWPNRDCLKHLYYPDDVLALIAEMRFWLTTKDWHLAKRIPWKRGWLLHGRPGTGKTALARAFAQDLDLPVHVFELAGMSNKEFLDAWSKMVQDTPCVALLEDFDNVFDKRKNLTGMFGMGMGPRRRRKKRGLLATTSSDVPITPPVNEGEDSISSQQAEAGGSPWPDPYGDDDDDDMPRGGLVLTFDTLLNALDGVEQNDGVFTIFTTNDLSKIDPALGVPPEGAIDRTSSTRPGRIDRAIKLDFMLPEHKKAMAEWILSEFPDTLAQVIADVKDNPRDETPAQFQEKCAHLALQEKFRLSNVKKEKPECRPSKEGETEELNIYLRDYPKLPASDQRLVRDILVDGGVR